MKKLRFLIFIFAFGLVFPQKNQPTDGLTKEFFKNRREAFRQKMPPNSAAIVFAYPERIYAADINYKFHQNPDLYYLSGYTEPDGLLLIFKEKTTINGQPTNEIFFVREKNPQQEIWTGKRLGIEGAKTVLGFDQVLLNQDFPKVSDILKNVKPILFDDEMVNNEGNSSWLIGEFKKLGLHENPNAELHEEHKIIAKYLSAENISRFSDYYKEKVKTNEKLKEDQLIKAILNNPTATEIENIKRQAIKDPKSGSDFWEDIITELRQIKTTEELALMRKATSISCVAHIEAMKSIKPEWGENQVEAVHDFVHRSYGAESESYPPIVGAGENACTLHYVNNNATKTENTLVLMDVGSEYHGYASDVTRTIPANGKFSPEQKIIYELVYNAQDEVIKICKEGLPFKNLQAKSKEIIAQGLLDLGIIKNKEEVDIYYPHGVSHYVGLDVHDRGDYDILKENMVITVEPGIYIPEGSPCDKKWWNIGVRIEDDVLILKNGFENLSIAAPRKWDEIEKMAASKSAFNDINLPKLKD